MREQHAARKRVVGWVVGLATALGLGSPAGAQEQFPAFGMVGLANGQTAVLNLVLTSPLDPNHPGCRVTASFVNSDGDVFFNRNGKQFSEDFTLQPQKAKSFEMNSEDIADGQRRRPTRVVLTPPVDDTMPSDCRCVRASREIVNPDGRTTVLDLGFGNDSQGPPYGKNPPPPPICENPVFIGQ